MEIRNSIFLFALLIIASISLAQDIKDSKDHPLITRYPGSIINYYEEQQYKPYSIATGPETGYRHIEKWVQTEGKFTRIYYTVKGTTTLTEVYENYRMALKKGNFKTLAEGIQPESRVSKEVGGRSFLNTFYTKNPFPPSAGIKILNGSSTSAGACYIAARLEKPTGNVYIVVGGSQYTTTEKVFLIDIIEQTTLKNNLITVNAAEMLKGLKSDGKIALYGIYFDFDKAIIKPESEPTMKEISQLLTNNPELNVYIVGHTDLKGGLEYNITLSGNRANAVVNELVQKYSIQKNRLSAQGVGPFAPVSTNETEEGRKLNRRVELVIK